MDNNIDINKYKEIFKNVKNEILQAQYRAMQVVNFGICATSCCTNSVGTQYSTFGENQRYRREKMVYTGNYKKCCVF